MSQDNKDSEDVHDAVSTPSITFDVFKAYYKENTDLDNIEYYKAFPTVNSGTIRSWKAKAKTQLESEPPQTVQTPQDQPVKDNKYLTELVEVLKRTTRINPKLLEGLDLASQYKILQNVSSEQKPDPNIKVFTPAGGASQKLGIEKYMKIDEKAFREHGFGTVEISIPASKLYKPDESKKLKEYQ